jgi:hypothetical protein
MFMDKNEFSGSASDRKHAERKAAAGVPVAAFLKYR